MIYLKDGIFVEYSVEIQNSVIILWSYDGLKVQLFFPITKVVEAIVLLTL